MRHRRVVRVLIVVVIALSSQACTDEMTPERKQLVADLKQDLVRIRQDIEQATTDDAVYSGGLIKSLIGVRLELLKTNEALMEQRIHALEAGTRLTVVINAVNADPTRATELTKEIGSMLSQGSFEQGFVL